MIQARARLHLDAQIRLSSTFSEISNFICGGVPQGHGDLYILGERTRHETLLR